MYRRVNVKQTLDSIQDYRTTVILRDGSTVQIRSLQPDDEAKLHALFYRLSPQTIYFRFRRYIEHMTREEIRSFANVDHYNDFALVATIVEEQEERVVGVGRGHRLPVGNAATVTLLVEDAHQGRGIGTHLLEQLAYLSMKMGIHRFEAEILADNEQVLKMLKSSGFHMEQELESGIYRIVMPIGETAGVEERSAEREKIATIASLRAFLRPRSIAVIGASNRQGTIGNKLFRNILQQGFGGIVYPVNPRTDVVASVRTYPSVLDVPGDVDMAVIIVPAPLVHDVVQQCGRKGVRALVVISAGFAEIGAEGKERQDMVLDTARSYGMRIVGPNCMGIINTEPDVSLNATFSSVFPPSGSLAFASQSGALGLAILEYARTLNIGLSAFISIGNRADVSSNDLLQYWEEDPATKVILLYLESFGNPRKFGRVARQVSQSKPIVAVKSGRTTAGSRAAASHTGALVTGEAASEALFKQAGVVRVNTLEELFDVSNLLQNQPLPPGRRVAILTNGGGPGIMTADVCAARGLEVPPLSDETVAAMREFLPEQASTANPVDMTAEATAEQYRRSLEVLAADDHVDIAIVIFIPPIVIQPEAVAGAIREVAPLFRERGKPLVASFMSSKGAPADLGSERDGYVPSYTFPESTADALAGACEYSEWLRRPKGTIPELPDIDREAGRALIDKALEGAEERPVWMDSLDAGTLLACYGLRLAPARTAATASEASRAASEIGFPVAVKLLSESITHKTDYGGVVLDLRSTREVEEAFNGIRANLAALGLAAEMQGVSVQKMVATGVEVIVGITQDPSFGPLVLFGTGGIYTELFKDVTFQIHPLTDIAAKDMVRSVKSCQLLEGWRGSKRSDIEALEDLLLRISALVEDVPEILELDLNPVKVLEAGKGCMVVDVRIRLSRMS